MDGSGNVIRNKVRLKVQGCTQIEGIDFDEIFTPVVRHEAIRMTLVFVSFKDFKPFQMDVRNAFLNGFIEEKGMLNTPTSLLILHIRILFLNLKKLCIV